MNQPDQPKTPATVWIGLVLSLPFAICVVLAYIAAMMMDAQPGLRNPRWEGLGIAAGFGMLETLFLAIPGYVFISAGFRKNKPRSQVTWATVVVAVAPWAIFGLQFLAGAMGWEL